VFPNTLIDQAALHRADLLADAAHQRLRHSVPRRVRPRRRLGVRLARPTPATASTSPTVCCA